MFFIAFKNSSQKEYILAHRLKGWKGKWKISQWQEQAAETPQLGKKQNAWRRGHWQLLFQFYSPLEPSPYNDAGCSPHSQAVILSTEKCFWEHPPRHPQRCVSQLIPNPVRLTSPTIHHQVANPSVINDLELTFLRQVWWAEHHLPPQVLCLLTLVLWFWFLLTPYA